MNISARYQIVFALLLVFAVSATVNSPTWAGCDPASGCVPKEKGTNARWWADSAKKGICRDHDPKKGEDWLVYYKTDNDTWKKADVSKIRFYAPATSLARYWKWTDSVQIEDNSLPGITLCLSGVLRESAVKNTWVWLAK